MTVTTSNLIFLITINFHSILSSVDSSQTKVGEVGNIVCEDTNKGDGCSTIGNKNY